MLFRLVLLNGPISGRQVTVPEDVMILGRAEDCDLSLDDPEVAAEHVELRMKEGALHLRDLGTLTGTLVNQVQVRDCRLRHGDVLEVGRTRLLVEAHVQADVPVGRIEAPSRRRGRLRAVAAVLLVLGVGWGIRRIRTPEPVSPAPEMTHRDVSEPWADEGSLSPLPIEEGADVAGERIVASLPPDEEGAPVSEILRLLREDIERMQEALSVLAESRDASEDMYEGPPRMEDPQVEAAHTVLDRARDALENDRLLETEQLLEGLRVLAPEFMPGLETWARLYERRGQYPQAAAKWAQMAELGPDSDQKDRALQQQARLIRLQRDVEAASISFRIAALSQRKFPERDGIEEMRTLTVRLVPEDPLVQPDPSAVSVEVAFYERELNGGAVFLSRRVPPVRLQPESEWAPGESKSLMATYRIDGRGGDVDVSTLPDGVGSDRAFVGYRVRLFVRNEMSEEIYRPITLADIPEPAAAAVRLEP